MIIRYRTTKTRKASPLNSRSVRRTCGQHVVNSMHSKGVSQHT